MFLGPRDKRGSVGLRCVCVWGGLTHSKCFLIFSDSAYLEIPLMKRVLLTWGRGKQVLSSCGWGSRRAKGEGLGVGAGLTNQSGLSGVFVIEAMR